MSLKRSRTHRQDTCQCGQPKDARALECVACRRHTTTAPTIQNDRERRAARADASSLKKKYDDALKTIERMEQSAATFTALNNQVERYTIEPKRVSREAEGTVVVLASDWHIEERVTPGQVSGLNEYNLVVAKERATRFFQSMLRLVRLLQQDCTITQVVLALLGDFITNQIHDAENAESNEMLPTMAIVEAQNHLISGIEFLLRNSTLTFVLPCHSGNHARTTKTTRFASENGHSLEYLMYSHLAAYFRHESRLQFIIPEGYHSYVTVYDTVIRFHHGHAIKYAGGVGGLYIPTNKKIAQYNKAIRADLDCFGHYHQLRDGGNFVCNGSLIGYNAYALSIGADYEPPKQALFLIDKRRGRTCLWPILTGANRTIPLAKTA